MKTFFHTLDRHFIHEMHVWAIPVLRVALGIVFLWFGALKLMDASPVVTMLSETWSFVPTQGFVLVLGILECLIGLGLIFKITLRATLFLLWLQMLGTLITPLLAPGMFFFHGNPFLLTMEGEFIVKNLVLVAAGLVVGGFEVGKRSR